MSKIHKVYLAFHSDDIFYKEKFEEMFADDIVTKSVQEGDISDTLSDDEIMRQIRENYLADSTVTVVLVGQKTYRRKFVDWEIYSSLRQTIANPRSGLVGILLPTRNDYNTGRYDPSTVPARLVDNNKTGFAKMYNWTTDERSIIAMIDDAFRVRKDGTVDLSRPRMRRNI